MSLFEDFEPSSRPAKKARTTRSSYQKPDGCSGTLTSFAALEERWCKAAEGRDNLMVLPTKAKMAYVNKSGQAKFDDRYALRVALRTAPVGENHPKIRQAKASGNWHDRLQSYFAELGPDTNIPIAGIPLASDSCRSRRPVARKPVLPCAEEWLEYLVGDGIEQDGESESEKRPPVPRVPSLPRRWAVGDGQAGLQEDSFHNRPSIKLPMSDHLKALLVDDWENVTKNQQLVPLPHPHPVDEILNDYLLYERPHRPENSASLEVLEETIAGLHEYFDKCLGRILLYRFERAQFHELHTQWMAATPGTTHKGPGDTYGAEHLARLLVSLPELVAQTNMDQQSVNRLREELTKFTTWFGRHVTKYFVNEYETPSQEYVDQARSA
ncbi:MRG-domain-containing protein [Bombardia bombarda]|uniref:Chromatin modification-related protein EAF3 n=1 Tax=Bombardia bombarda TaxID=252184 RepID=A0AA39XIB0_9PEZI|nr:MRG-domain-containing protein [Bombardia bombarda]